MYLSIILMSISLSIDALGIGISYGIKNINIPFASKIIISIQSFIIIYLSLILGNTIVDMISKNVAKYLGILILILMGIVMIYQGINKKNIDINKKMLTIKIIKSPPICDFNSSKKIEPFEAIYLGMALSIDSFGVSLGSGVYGISGFFLPLSAVFFQILFVSLGLHLGKKVKNISNVSENIWVIISGIILLIIALIKII